VKFWKGKLCDRTLEDFQIRDKPNLDDIIKAYKGYCDWIILHNSLGYFEKLQKKLFEMIQQVGPPTFFCHFHICEKIVGSFCEDFTHFTCYRIRSPK
jgi:hypothetical protein